MNVPRFGRCCPAHGLPLAVQRGTGARAPEVLVCPAGHVTDTWVVARVGGRRLAAASRDAVVLSARFERDVEDAMLWGRP